MLLAAEPARFVPDGRKRMDFSQHVFGLVLTTALIGAVAPAQAQLNTGRV